MFTFPLQLLSENISHSKKNSARFRKYLHVKYRLIVSNFKETGIFKNSQVSNFMKILPMGAELFHAGGQTDRNTKSVFTFRNFANASKIY